MPRFGGIPVEKQEITIKPRFGGMPVDDVQPESVDVQPQKSGLEGLLSAIFPRLSNVAKPTGQTTGVKLDERQIDALKKPDRIKLTDEQFGQLQEGGRTKLTTPQYEKITGKVKLQPEQVQKIKETKAPIDVKQGLKEGAAGALDVLSIPGRTLASAPAIAGGIHGGGLKGGKEAFIQEMSKSEPSPNDPFVQRIVEGIVRDPATLATLGIGTGAGTVGKVALQGLKAGITSAAIHQAENIAADKNISFGEALTEVSLSTLLPVLGKGIGKAFSVGGTQQIKSIIKPTNKAMKEGFKVENIFKHKLGANTLDGIEQKTSQKLTQLGDELKNIIKEGTESGITIDIDDAMSKTIGKFTNKIEHAGENKALQKGLQDLAEELTESIPAHVNKIDLANAQMLKRGIGKQGAWFQGSVGKVADPDVSARGKVYNEFYRQLKEQIAKKTPPSLSKINKQFEEIIPIERAVQRRLAGDNRYPFPVLYTLLGGIGGIGAGAYGEGTWQDRLKRAVAGAAFGMGSRKILQSQLLGRGLYEAGEQGLTEVGRRASRAAVQQRPEVVRTFNKIFFPDKENQ